MATPAVKLPPYAAGEISARMLAVVPELRGLLNQDEVRLSGEQFEDFIRAVWLCGYGEGMAEISETPGELPDLARRIAAAYGEAP